VATLPPPGLPVIYPGLDTVTQWNTGINTQSGTSGGVRDTLSFMRDKPKFRARRAATQAITENVHQFMVWDTIDFDNYGGGSAGSSIYTVMAQGWYICTARVSLLASAAGAANLILIPALAVNGSSPSGVGASGWEGPEVPVPTAAAIPKAANGIWQIYALVGDQIQVDLFFSAESTITSTDNTAGWQPEISLVWAGK
jgi:hypothetical protein